MPRDRSLRVSCASVRYLHRFGCRLPRRRLKKVRAEEVSEDSRSLSGSCADARSRPVPRAFAVSYTRAVSLPLSFSLPLSPFCSIHHRSSKPRNTGCTAPGSGQREGQREHLGPCALSWPRSPSLASLLLILSHPLSHPSLQCPSGSLSYLIHFSPSR